MAITDEGAYERNRRLRILFLVSAHNGLSQRAESALSDAGHEVAVEVVGSAAAMETAVCAYDPQLIVCPFLKKMIPESIWSRHRCLILHPGPRGDRGPSSLDWAIELGMREWGVTVLEANGEFDAGAILSTRGFQMRDAGKSSLYRHEVRHAAIEALSEAVDRIADPHGPSQQSLRDEPSTSGTGRPLMTQDTRAIDWQSDGTDVVLRKLRAAEGHPGVLDVVQGEEFHLFGGHRETALRGRPGEILAQRLGAICRGTIDGAVWITHLKRRVTHLERSLKLPATRALALAGHRLAVPEVMVPLRGGPGADRTYREIVFEQQGGVGYLQFDFYNGAMSTDQCERLRDAYLFARAQPGTKVIVLMGGRDYFSNGIHLNLIEAAEDPGSESWRNLNAINDVVREIVTTDSHMVISALGGDAAAGGVPLALAADHVVAREDVVLNPYYQHMGGLYGSEYWTYLLPRRVGVATTARLVGEPFVAVGAREAVRIGLLDDAFGASWEDFQAGTIEMAQRLASDAGLPRRLEQKRRRRAYDETVKPLQTYCDEELARSYDCFFGPDRSYHEARRRFAYKLGPTEPGAPDRDVVQRLSMRTHTPAGRGRRIHDHNCRDISERAR